MSYLWTYVFRMGIVFLSFHSFVHSTMITQIALSKFIQKYPAIKHIQCTQKMHVEMNRFPLFSTTEEKYFPSKVNFLPISIIEVPKGLAYFDVNGYVFLNNCFIKEMQIKHLNFFNNRESIEVFTGNNGIKVKGRVAIISHLYPYCYGHWIFDVLGQLALLEMHNIAYDYLCVPYYKPFMKESLELWGIDSSKIIPLTLKTSLLADTIIMTTPVTQTDVLVFNSNYNIDFILRYVSQKLLSKLALSIELNKFSEKIFISRKDAGGKRSMPNEDEIFSLFEAVGFKRYSLATLPFVQQIALFHNAKSIVNFVGSGGVNTIFCKPGTHYIEISQKMVDATFFYVADMFKLQYSCINNSTIEDIIGNAIWAPGTNIPVQLVKDFLAQHQEFIT